MSEDRESLIEESITSGNLVYVGSFFENIEEVGFLLENFDSFTKNFTKDFTMAVIAFWYKQKPSAIVETFNEAINSLFFEKIIPIFSSFPPDSKFNACLAMTQFIIINYPSNIPDFWQTLLTFDEDFVKSFLLTFMNETSILSINRLEPFSAVKTTMKEDGSADAILTWTFELMSRDPVIALKILHKYCYWCSIDFIGDESAVGLLQSALSQGNLAPIVLDVFSVVIQRLAKAPEKDQVIAMLCEPESLLTLVSENPENFELHGAVGRIVYTVGVLSSEKEVMYETAIQLLDTTQQAIQAVVPFICAFIRSQNSTFEIQETISAAYQRIVSFFNDSDLTLPLYVKLYDENTALAKIIVSCWLINQETALAALSAILEDESVSAANIATICHIIKCMTEEKQKVDSSFIESIFQYCIPIIEISAPFTADNLCGFYSFTQLFFNTYGKINSSVIPDEAISSLLTTFTNIVFDEALEMDSKEPIIDLFTKFALASKGRIPPQQEIITALLGTENHKLTEVAASLMACDNEYCAAQATEAMRHLMSSINAENKETILSPLSFLGSEAGSSVSKDEAAAMLTALQQHCSDDETLGYLAMAAEKVHGDNCPQFYASVIDNFTSPSAVCNVARGCKAHLKRGMVIEESDMEWFNTLIAGMFHHISVLVDVNDGLKRDNRDIEEAVSNFVFVAKCQFQYIYDDLKQEMFAFAGALFQRTPDSMIIYKNTVSFLAEYVISSLDSVIEVISPAPQNICFAQNFDSLSDELPQIMQTIKYLFKKIHMKAPEAFEAMLNETSENFGFEPESIREFFLIKESLKEFSKDDSRLFFQKLVLMRCSSGL